MPSIRDTLSEKSRGAEPAALRILVIEDNALIAMLLEATLSDMGYAVCAVEATETGAVAAAALHRPDLLIVDAGLSEGSGVSAVDRILRDGFVPHVFVSGADLKPEMLDSRAVRLTKPYDQRALVTAIQRALIAPIAV
jgi:two-component system, response regulator PdtaR